ncbi:MULTISPECIES: alanine:cation symporter family protein [Auritidibacter]|uniref:alanine:cation symporter family protein n=1 Tax=Auritidibacter TaxID=1160973 RepID=UPI0016B1E1C6|nr:MULTISPECIES: alanine:cation symporter family protein [Auritidibacter]NIH71340.1 Na+/alanine symporter [Auritidibacter ignavus]WGH81468.1 alanine:cation symporter family protein [Auritidibacter ignavus]WGH83725.1 alanine:cation symporter family protein [Auritidibacter ignavus]WGH85240.1 alanine:cation symporter family protein [Auritidibacter ignavus]WGH87528.1 alanine:cation symporter family protein [Auritidibacter ignavus]
MNAETISEMLGQVEDMAWQLLGMPVIILLGFYLTVRTGMVQIRHLPDMFRAITDRATRDDTGRTRSLSAFQAFAVTASARVGTGNIAGVAGAIAMGGPGAVFWMWGHGDPQLGRVFCGVHTSPAVQDPSFRHF